ncbi:undecaprenyl-phosphate glucose phosphotransferase [Oricola cellulosilytica]|uniref:Undecaprenyl-phosphate glucose phosphotransferase n=1 Tax=Oricola cellulosilytica TaxID=1429082 RepID=A0A4R0PAY3_9HYPH|nr:undecaprenyl-phosphate glucose phosphotransferase [Oricola cellulosilytica]TCD14400.1 undecaprenyl-phosphate glucose phosphotransferase [Oricola cellulosilytica]
MNEVDPKLRYNAEAVKNHRGSGDLGAPEVSLDPLVARIADEFRKDSISPVMVSGYLRIGEFATLSLIAATIMIAYVGVGQLWTYALAILFGSGLFVVLNEFSDGYDLRALRKPISSLPRIVFVWIATFALLALAAFLLKISDSFSRVWSGSWFVAGLVFLVATRLLVGLRVRTWARNGIMERRAVIVGGGKSAEKLIRALEVRHDSDIRICGIFDDRDDDRSPPVVAGYPKLGNIDELVTFTRRARIDMLIVALPLDAEDRVLTMLKRLWILPVDIRLSAHSNKLRFRPRTYSFIGSVPMLDIFDRPIRDWDSVAKRAFDIFFSVFGIVTLAPVMVATAIAIKLDSKGPVIFRQKRHGFNNEMIDVFKFRSMYTDQCDPTARNQVVKDDPRVTPIGRFIRKTSIDELPQFFNVLRGDLSLVGPRPHAVSAQSRNRLYGEVVDGYFGRHRVKPGVTGWAQINGWRGEIDTDEKIRRRTEFDLYYIENWSLWFDLKILFLTPIRLLNTENAY